MSTADYTRAALRGLELPHAAREAKLEAMTDTQLRNEISGAMVQIQWLQAAASVLKEHGVWDEVLAFIEKDGAYEPAAAA